MARHEASAERFKQDVRNAGFQVGLAGRLTKPIADALNCSVSHVRNMISGHNRPGDELQARLDTLIDRVASGALPDCPAPLSPLNQAIIDQAPDSGNSATLSKHETRYRVVGCVVRSEVVQFTEVATFASPVAAGEYADWLNGQTKRGKEAG